MDVKTEYQTLYPVADRFRLAIFEQVSGLVSKNNISLGVPIESRVKSYSSIDNKLSRKSEHISSLYDLSDFVGLRLILLFKDDVEKACNILTDNFDVIESEDTSTRLSENEFGYQSNHLILKMPSSWIGVPSYSDFSDMKVEVQVRTLSQHTWAAASHKLQYKQEKNVPLPLKRSIHRLSALLETVDLELCRLLNERRDYINEGMQNAINDDRLNVNIIEALCDELLPKLNKVDNEEDYAEVMDELFNVDIKSASELKALIVEYKPEMLNEDRQRAKERHFEQQESERAKLGVYFTHVGLVRGCLDLKFGDTSKDYRLEKFPY